MGKMSELHTSMQDKQYKIIQNALVRIAGAVDTLGRLNVCTKEDVDYLQYDLDKFAEQIEALQ